MALLSPDAAREKVDKNFKALLKHLGVKHGNLCEMMLFEGANWMRPFDGRPTYNCDEGRRRPGYYFADLRTAKGRADLVILEDEPGGPIGMPAYPHAIHTFWARTKQGPVVLEYRGSGTNALRQEYKGANYAPKVIVQDLASGNLIVGLLAHLLTGKSAIKPSAGFGEATVISQDGSLNVGTYGLNHSHIGRFYEILHGS